MTGFEKLKAVTWIGALAFLACAVAGAPAAGAATDAAPADAWPSFRGTPSLSAVSEAAIPDSPKVKWTFETEAPVKGAAAIVEGHVYIGSEDGKVYALNLADGAVVWTFEADGPVVSSPLVHEGRVYIGSAGTNLFALSAADGREVWRYGIDAEIKSSANWFQAPEGGGTWILVGGYDSRLHCVDAANGTRKWTYDTGNYVNGAPAVGEGRTVFGGCDAIVHVVDLARGIREREVEAGAYIIGSAALVDGIAYVGHYENEFLAVDTREGAVLWRYRDRNFPYGGSPAVTAEHVLFGGRDKRLHCVDRASGKAVWTFTTRGRVESSPVVARDRVIVGSDDGRVYVVNLADGRELWSYEIGESVQGSPAVVDGHVVIGADDGVVYCFGPS